ncbi:hypothetical protein FRC11_008462 [Ceratobasidium sp. 423]|nr:hypothetical protein FRC11_008462 [Ceratobasidium sp. 423]
MSVYTRQVLPHNPLAGRESLYSFLDSRQARDSAGVSCSPVEASYIGDSVIAPLQVDVSPLCPLMVGHQRGKGEFCTKSHNTEWPDLMVMSGKVSLSDDKGEEYWVRWLKVKSTGEELATVWRDAPCMALRLVMSDEPNGRLTDLRKFAAALGRFPHVQALLVSSFMLPDQGRTIWESRLLRSVYETMVNWPAVVNFQPLIPRDQAELDLGMVQLAKDILGQRDEDEERQNELVTTIYPHLADHIRNLSDIAINWRKEAMAGRGSVAPSVKLVAYDLASLLEMSFL